MMVGILLGPLLLESLFVSVVLIVLNRRGAGPAASAATTIAMSIALVMAMWLAYGAAGSVRQMLKQSLLLVLLPSAAIFALSRLSLFVHRPWLLLLLGPIAFVVTVAVVVIAVNLSS